MPRRSPRTRALLAWLALAFLLFLTAACGSAAADMKAGASSPPGMPPSPPPAQPSAGYAEEAELNATDEPRSALAAVPEKKGAGAVPGAAATAAPAADTRPAPPPSASDAPKMAAPLLIYTAELHVSTFETAKAIDQVQKLALDAGGYLVVRDDVSITIRVPSDRFTGTLDGVMKVGDVLHRNISVRDITEEYYDLQTRLRNAEAVLERLTELLRRAEKVEDALAVEKELQRVAEDVERLKGRLKLLKELVAFSTISVRFEPRSTETVGSKVNLPFPWLDSLGLGNLLNL